MEICTPLFEFMLIVISSQCDVILVSKKKKGPGIKNSSTIWHGYDEKVVCLTGAAHEDRCAWNICLFYHIGWDCIARLKSHLTIGIRLGWRMACQKRATITQCSWHSQYKCQKNPKNIHDRALVFWWKEQSTLQYMKHSNRILDIRVKWICRKSRQIC